MENIMNHLPIIEAKQFVEHIQNPLVRLVSMTSLFPGMRLSECLFLKAQDIDFDRRMIFVRGKGGHRTIPIHSTLLPLLREYVEPLEIAEGDLPFFRLRDGHPLKAASVTRVLHYTAKQFPLDGQASFRQLRYSFIRELLVLNVSIEVIYVLVGDKPRIFTRLSPISVTDLRWAVDQLPDQISKPTLRPVRGDHHV